MVEDKGNKTLARYEESFEKLKKITGESEVEQIVGVFKKRDMQIARMVERINANNSEGFEVEQTIKAIEKERKCLQKDVDNKIKGFQKQMLASGVSSVYNISRYFKFK